VPREGCTLGLERAADLANADAVRTRVHVLYDDLVDAHVVRAGARNSVLVEEAAQLAR